MARRGWARRGKARHSKVGILKRPSDIFRIDQQIQNDLEFEMCRIAFAYMDQGMPESAAFDLAYAAVGLSLLYNLKNELEDIS